MKEFFTADKDKPMYVQNTNRHAYNRYSVQGPSGQKMAFRFELTRHLCCQLESSGVKCSSLSLIIIIDEADAYTFSHPEESDDGKVGQLEYIGHIPDERKLSIQDLMQCAVHTLTDVANFIEQMAAAACCDNEYGKAFVHREGLRLHAVIMKAKYFVVVAAVAQGKSDTATEVIMHACKMKYVSLPDNFDYGVAGSNPPDPFRLAFGCSPPDFLSVVEIRCYADKSSGGRKMVRYRQVQAELVHRVKRAKKNHRFGVTNMISVSPFNLLAERRRDAVKMFMKDPPQSNINNYRNRNSSRSYLVHLKHLKKIPFGGTEFFFDMRISSSTLQLKFDFLGITIGCLQEPEQSQDEDDDNLEDTLDLPEKFDERVQCCATSEEIVYNFLRRFMLHEMEADGIRSNISFQAYFMRGEWGENKRTSYFVGMYRTHFVAGCVRMDISDGNSPTLVLNMRKARSVLNPDKAGPRTSLVNVQYLHYLLDV